MRILIYGSTYLTEVCCRVLSAKHQLIGYVPNVKAPTVPGNVPLPVASGDEPCEIALSIQYDHKITPRVPTFNVHTGLLPEWGGCDILYHTLREGAHEQGLTFHQVTDRFDYGPIISKITYPVLPGDTMVDLYRRLVAVGPGFVDAALDLFWLVNVIHCFSAPPRLFKRGDILPEDRGVYTETPGILRKEFLDD